MLSSKRVSGPNLARLESISRPHSDVINGLFVGLRVTNQTLAVGNIVSDLTDLEIERKTSRSDSDLFNNYSCRNFFCSQGEYRSVFAKLQRKGLLLFPTEEASKGSKAHVSREQRIDSFITSLPRFLSRSMITYGWGT